MIYESLWDKKGTTIRLEVLAQEECGYSAPYRKKDETIYFCLSQPVHDDIGYESQIIETFISTTEAKDIIAVLQRAIDLANNTS